MLCPVWPVRDRAYAGASIGDSSRDHAIWQNGTLAPVFITHSAIKIAAYQENP